MIAHNTTPQEAVEQAPPYYVFEPTWSLPPGETLKEWAEESRVSDERVAIWLGLTVEALNDLYVGRLRLDADMARKLEHVTGWPARCWNNLEAEYRAKRPRKRAQSYAPPPGEIIILWAQTHDPDYTELKELFFGDSERLDDLLAARIELTPEDALLLAALTEIPGSCWSALEYRYRDMQKKAPPR